MKYIIKDYIEHGITYHGIYEVSTNICKVYSSSILDAKLYLNLMCSTIHETERN
jgi:hypothetical protein